MKGLRWFFAFLRDAADALGGSIATIRARLAPLESRIQLTVTEALRNAARKLALGVVAAAFTLAGVAYVSIGPWLGLESHKRLGAWFLRFLSFSAVPVALLNRMS